MPMRGLSDSAASSPVSRSAHDTSTDTRNTSVPGTHSSGCTCASPLRPSPARSVTSPRSRVIAARSTAESGMRLERRRRSGRQGWVGSCRPARTTRRVAVGGGTRRPGHSCGPGRRRGCGGEAGANRAAEKGSWNVRVWLTTPVDSVTCACAWPTPACGRIAVPMRNPSRREREQRLVDGRVVGRADEAGPHVELGRADRVGITRCRHRRSPGPPTRRPSPTRRCPRGGDRRRGSAWRMRSGSSAREQHERPRAQPVALTDGHGAAGEGSTGVHAVDGDLDAGVRQPPRANTVWTVLTDLLVVPLSAATMVWASSWPPKTTPGPVSVFVGPVAVGADRLEHERGEEGFDRRHLVPYSRVCWRWSSIWLLT